MFDDLFARCEAGLLGLAAVPGLLAEADQHAAAVRDVIIGSGQQLDRTSLQDYLRGFIEVAVEKGWWPGEEFDWELLRATAVLREIRTLSTVR